MASPPTKDEVLQILRLVTPEDYHGPFFDDPNGAIAQYRGWARAGSELAARIGRATSRQLFLAGPDRESAGFAEQATMQVTLRRTENLDRLLWADVGSLTIEGPQERVYRSTQRLVFYPFDPVAELTIELQCDLIGEYGNLDFLADDDGMLSDPVTGGPALDLVDLQDRSRGRAGIKATLELVDGEPSRLTAAGLSPTFSQADVGLYVQITNAASSANIGRVLRIVGYEVDDLEVIDETYARTVLLDDTPQPALVSAAILDDGGVQTDYTDEARSRASDDLTLLPETPAVNDAVYFGSTEPFVALRLLVTDERFGTLTLTWEIWTGASWVEVEVDDPSAGFSVIGEFDLELGDTTGWAITTVDGRSGYFIRARVSAFTDQTNQPKAALALVLVEQELVADTLDSNGDGQISWALLDWRDLGVEIVSMTAPEGGRENTMALKLRERGLTQRERESLAMLRRRASRFPDVVTPEAIEWEINRILEPLGLGGKVIDLGDGFQGLFWDVSPGLAPSVVGAWDLYEDGDLFPEDTTMLPLSLEETKWHFWVVVPHPSLGEFGAAWDVGPPAVYVEALGMFVGSAWDAGFTDGYAVVSAMLYKQVYDVVSRAKAAGISFTMITGDVPLCG